MTSRKLETFRKTLAHLQELRTHPTPLSDVEKAGFVSFFEQCFEASWKAQKELLAKLGVNEADSGSPRSILKASYAAHVIDDEAGWLAMLDARNEIIHSYDEEIADKIIDQARSTYLPIFETLSKKLEAEWSDFDK